MPPSGVTTSTGDSMASKVSRHSRAALRIALWSSSSFSAASTWAEMSRMAVTRIVRPW